MNVLLKCFGYVKRFFMILWYASKRFVERQDSQRTIALTYCTVFSIVPLAALLFGLAKGFSLDDRLRDIIMDKLWQHQELLNIIMNFSDTTLKQARGGVVGGIGVIALIITVFFLGSNVENSFNAVWELPNRKNYLKCISDYMVILLLTPIVLVIMSSTGVFLKTLFNSATENFQCQQQVAGAFNMTAYLFSVAIVCLVVTLVYKGVPNTKVKWSSALLAGIVSGILLQCFQEMFIFLQRSIFNYNRIYGSFAILPLFLIWLQWSWQIVIFGAEISFVSQRYDSGVFNRKSNRQPSWKSQIVQQLVIARVIYREYSQGSGATCESTLQEKSQLSPIDIDDGVTALLRAGIIAEVADGESRSFLPNKSITTFRIFDCVNALANCGDPEDKIRSADQRDIIALINDLQAERANSNFNRLLID